MSTLPILEGYRISPEQRRAWVVQQSKRAEPGASAVVMVEGRLDGGRLRNCVDWTAKQYEILRTNFKQLNGMTEPLQVISDDAEWLWSKKDLTGYSAQEQQEIVNRVAGTCVQQMRVELIDLSDRSAAVVFCMPALVTDRTGLVSLVRAVILRYLGEGQESSMQAQYADIAQILNESLDFPEFDTGRSYWMQQWSGEARQEALAKSLCVHDGMPFQKASVQVQGITGQSAAILRRCAEWNCTPQDFLLACWLTLALRHAEGWMPVVGFGGGGRNHEVIAEAPGLLVRYLPVWVDVNLQSPLREMVDKVAAATSEAVGWQQFFDWKQIESAEPVPILRWCFESCSIAESMSGEGIHFQITGVWGISDGFAQRLVVQERRRSGGDVELSGEIDYDAAGMRAQEAQWLAEELETVVEGALAKPEAAIGALPIIGRMQREMLYVWNQTKGEYAREKCVHELFEEQVERTPDVVAVAYGEEQLSYAELNSQANRLAHYLRTIGVGPEARVAICLERSLELVVSLLAALKAGGAYVPLEPAYPADRLRYMLADSAPVAVLTATHWEQLGLEGAARVVDVVRQGELWAAQPETNPDRSTTGVGGRQSAYVIYTSGSTGTPKGAMNEHSAVCNRLRWMQEAYGLDSGDAVLQKTPFSFDVSVWEFFWPLMTAARLVMARPGGHKDPGYLSETIRENGITTVHFVPSMLQAFLEQAGELEGLPLKRVVCSGEALTAGVVRSFYKRMPQAGLHNLYGPTEAAVDVTAWACPVGVEQQRIPIGRPISNTRVYIVDEEFEPVPVGVAGELYIGGAQVGRGYLKQPEMTAGRFVPDPFTSQAGARVYRTGDLGRWLADGTIEFLGRNDFQVKIRGYRIELGEIEARLAKHEGIREAVVVAREETGGDKRLVAYYTSNNGSIEVEELRGHMGAKLPEYMVPAAYVWLRWLPLTANGKLDRKALPSPKGDAYARRGYEEPQGEIESKLAAIWAELLKLERVGRHDSFFELGGHSLLAIMLIERMRRKGLQSTVWAVFAAPTLAELAASLNSEARVVEVPPNRIPESCDAITPEMLPLVDLTVEEIERIVSRIPGGAANVQDIYPLAPMQLGILFHHLMGEEGDVYLNSGLESFSTRSHLDSYLSALRAFINRHDILRTAVMWEGLREPVQVVCKNVELPLTEVALDSGAENVAEQLWSRFDPRSNRLDISQAPMLRLMVAHDATQERWLLVWWYSHLLGDHVALEVLREEIQAHLLGQENQLPAPTSFRDFVAQARLGVSREEHEAFFRKMLSDVEEPIAPFGLLDVQGDGSGKKQDWMWLDSSLAKRIRERARKLGVSPAALWHVAWAQVLARASGREDVVFGTVLFGRAHGGTGAERGMGLFINTLPVRFRMGEEGVEGGVRRMHRLLADLLRHEQAPLALVQRCSRVPAPAPLFTSLLNYRYSPEVGKAPSPDRLRAFEGMKVLYVEERTNYPLSFAVDDIGQDFALTAETEASIDPKRVCEYMHTALKSLVEALESAPERAISSLEILPEEERKQLLYEWNATGVEYPREKCIQQLFEEQVQKTPEAVAVIYEDANLTYGELNRRANQLARCFQDAYGLCAGDLAAIQMERSSQMVECILAIWKCGAAYVPVEPDYPNDHLRGILAEARPRLVVTQEELSKIKPNLHNYQGLNLDQPVRAEDLAYVIFTSGSTGKPKGAMIEHAGMLNHLLAKIDDLEITSDSVIAQNTSHCFDISVWQMFAAFLVGGQTIIYGNDTVHDPEKLLERVTSDGVTVLEVVPSYLGALLLRLEGQRGACFRLKYLVVTGEVVKPHLVDMWFKIFPNIAVINAYGPTEASDDITHYFMYTYPTAPSIPVGKPIRNTHIYVVDYKGDLCLMGVTGEIWVSGAGVGRGYLNDAEKTSLAFGPDPFCSEAGARLYRTGDLGSFSAEGDLLLSGRKDDQVKIRGYRIELGEIEARLSEHPQVLEAAVAAREDGGGGKRLVAYVVVAESKVEEERLRHSLQERGEVYAGELSAMLRAYLAGQLPEYMVPAIYVRLGSMPLTPNGKLDRRALPEPERDAYASRGYVEPQGETESKLAKIWEKLLGAPQVGLHDNFFELGGHSLLAMQLMVEVRRLFSINILLRDIFMSPTLAELAATLKRGNLGIRHQNLIPVRPAGTQTPLFLVHALGGGVDYMVNLAPFINADIPIYGLQATGFAPGQEPLKTIEEMAELYVDGIRQVQPHGPYRVAGWSAGGTIAYEMARKLTEMGERVEFVGFLDTVYSERKTKDSEIGPPKDFDANSELIQLLSMILDKKDLDDVIQMAQIYDFETLIERGSYIMDKIAKEYPSVHTLDISVLRRILTIRHATSNALLHYSFVRLSVPVWLFEARETVSPSGPAWRALLGDDLQVVPVQGTHHTITSLENVRSLGAAITDALAKNSAHERVRNFV